MNQIFSGLQLVARDRVGNTDGSRVTGVLVAKVSTGLHRVYFDTCAKVQRKTKLDSHHAVVGATEFEPMTVVFRVDC